MKLGRYNTHLSAGSGKGFTLIEVVVAVAIAALLLAGSFTGYNVIARRVQFSACNLAANTLAMGEMEKLLSPSGSLVLSVPSSGSTSANLCLPTSGGNVVNCTVNYSVTEVSGYSPYAVLQVQCVWPFNSFGTYTNTVVVLHALSI